MLEPPAAAGFFAATTATTLAVELRAGRTSAVELTRHALDAIRRLDDQLNAFVTVDAEGALASARCADDELGSGVDRGPLQGLPIAVKDLIDTAGVRTTMGSRHFASYVPERDARCIELLRRAGAVILGKTTTHEFAYGPTGDRSANGAARNPYDPHRMSGGSSAGSAVAVAAGMVPLSIGTDTGGSVRIPAALSGVVGFKPTYGSIPTDGVFPLASSLDHVGVMARSAGDIRLTLDVLTGAAHSHEDTAASPPGRPRIGWIDPELFGPVDPAVSDAARTAIEQWAGEDADLDEVAVRDVQGMPAAFANIQGSEAYATHADRISAKPHLFDDEVLVRLEAAGAVRGWEYVRAKEAQRRSTDTLSRLVEAYDVLALPTVPAVAPEIDQRDIDVNGRPTKVRAALLSLTSPWNLVGFPAISVPVGMLHGLPTALQLIAAPRRDKKLLAFAERAHTAADAQV